MDTPEPVMRNGIMTYAVPDISALSCDGCCMHIPDISACRWEKVNEWDVKSCIYNRTIYIEATPEAYAHYVTQRIQKDLQP